MRHQLLLINCRCNQRPAINVTSFTSHSVIGRHSASVTVTIFAGRPLGHIGAAITTVVITAINLQLSASQPLSTFSTDIQLPISGLIISLWRHTGPQSKRRSRPQRPQAPPVFLHFAFRLIFERKTLSRRPGHQNTPLPSSYNAIRLF